MHKIIVTFRNNEKLFSLSTALAQNML